MLLHHPLASLAVVLAVSTPGAPARAGGAALQVVTTTPGLAALARGLGGDRVEATSLARGTQDPHFVDANPTLAVKLRDAALILDVGLDLEAGWLPPLVTQSRNGEIGPGGRRRFTATQAIEIMDAAAGPVDRSQGDLHPGGNPHFLSDPRRVLVVARALSAKLAELDASGASTYTTRLAEFEQRLAEAQARWSATLAPLKGRAVITHHRTLTYFLDWAGLRAAGFLEPKPGIPPPPSHLAQLVVAAKAQGVKAVLVEAYYDARSAEIVARHAGAKVVVLPGDVGGLKDERGKLEPQDWFAYVDALVERVSGALR